MSLTETLGAQWLVRGVLRAARGQTRTNTTSGIATRSAQTTSTFPARLLRERPHAADRIVLEVDGFGGHEAADPRVRGG